ncbi:FixH family protein [Candidatus Nitronereus thalassa]|uniref:FixH family protein n=1 Tax=Candidatus Nitronereus thalassa TaxID=3020898 RepID=A0ABU3KBI6_9BACT|nr:FixH family protein [Candidatus Nitronereus thalassa]MDT7043688.1 FixH family protein [Candidatus Nitronereus thalassa]
MHKLKPKRFIGMVIGLVIIVVGGGVLLLKKEVLHQFQPKAERPSNIAGQPKPTMPSMERIAMPAGTEVGPAQAYAMVPPTQQQLIGVKTDMVGKQHLETAIRAVGRVDYDEKRIAHVNLRISGWVEGLFVNETGKFVRKGQPLFTLYSQELVTTQEEYLLALSTQDQLQDSPLPEVREQAAQVVETARDRLRLWTLTDDQIRDLASRGKPQTYVTIFSPVSGHVIEKKVFKGMYVEPTMTLYSIADLSTVWVQAEIFEYEMPFVRVNQKANLTLDAYPGESFHGQVAYIYPYLNKEARTVKVRLEFLNPTLRLKPDMYGTASIQVKRGHKLAVPDQAILDSGMRKVVFVVRGEGMFEPRQITVGPKVGPYYEVVEGLREGERIVTSGTFLLDSESQLMTSTNMMGALGMGGVKMEQAAMGEMDMGGMDMGGMNMKMDMKMDMKGQEMTAEKQPPAGRLEKKAGGLTLVFTTDPTPARMGENRVHVTVTDKNGKPVTDAKIQVTFTMPMPGMIPATVSMTPGKQGTYDAKVNLGMAGQWDLTVTIQRPGLPEVNATFSVVAGGGGMSGMPGM